MEVPRFSSWATTLCGLMHSVVSLSEFLVVVFYPQGGAEKIEPGKTGAAAVSMDTPGHERDEAYQELAKSLRSTLARSLVVENGGLFTAVVPDPAATDYALVVTLTSASIPRRSGHVKAHMHVQLIKRVNNKTIADFEAGAGYDEVGVNRRAILTHLAIITCCYHDMGGSKSAPIPGQN